MKNAGKNDVTKNSVRKTNARIKCARKKITNGKLYMLNTTSEKVMQE